MAEVALVPVTFNVNMRKGAYQQFRSSPVLGPTGTAIDLSGWSSITAKLVAQSPGPNTTDVTLGTCAGSAAGVITLTQAEADLAAANPGSANLVIIGINVVGDDEQLLASGSAQLAAG